MRPDQTERIDEARRTDMEPIYPLEKDYYKDGVIHRTVNQRLAPIFEALLDDPDGWEYDIGDSIPTTHEGCDNFRIVPKRRIIAVEFDKPVQVVSMGKSIRLEFDSQSRAVYALEAIRKAVESKE